MNYSITINESEHKYQFTNGRLQATAPTTSLPHTLAYKASIVAPTLTDRAWKAAQLVTEGHVTLTNDGGIVISGHKTYTITGQGNDLTCTNCPDLRAPHHHGRRLCKHIIAIRQARKLGHPILIEHQFTHTDKDGKNHVLASWQLDTYWILAVTYIIDENGRIETARKSHHNPPLPQHIINQHTPTLSQQIDADNGRKWLDSACGDAQVEATQKKHEAQLLQMRNPITTAETLYKVDRERSNYLRSPEAKRRRQIMSHAGGGNHYTTLNTSGTHTAEITAKLIAFEGDSRNTRKANL